ncbi:MAG: PspC domain-containing protein [Sphingobacteriales bacterium]|jgi:phage shock protein PspC (stress-responsive transcriptional regulator)
MHRSSSDKWFGGVLGGIAQTLGVSSALLRIVFIILFFGIGGLSFGIAWGAVIIIYFLCWMILPRGF